VWARRTSRRCGTRSAAEALACVRDAADDDEDLEFRSVDAGVERDRAWQGYVGSLDEPARAPLELAWQRLWACLGDRPTATAPDDSDKRVFARLWVAAHGRPGWVHRQLLELAPSLGTAALVGSIGTDLEAPDRELRILAVDALAMLSGKDLRRKAAGSLRPLDAIVGDYKALLRRPHGNGP
jgi:hypothetical protein